MDRVLRRARTFAFPHLSIMKWFVSVALLLVVAVLGYLVYVAGQIQKESTVDEEHAADAIVVLGAAEYRGRPSPVLEARLNHALYLYLKQLAPRIITTGGAAAIPSLPRAQ